MQKLIALLSLLALLLLFSGCGSKRVLVTPKDILENAQLIVRPPLGEWEIFRRPFNEDIEGRSIQVFHKDDIPGVRYSIYFNTYSQDYQFFNKNFRTLFDPTFDWYADLESKREIIKKNDKEWGVNYRKFDIRYLQGMKCRINVSSEHWGGYNANKAMKKYHITCGYYDTNGTKQVLQISSRYQASISQNSPYKMAKDVNYKGVYLPIKVVENDFKKRLKSLYEGIDFKHMDIERMKREGLYHPDTHFECSPW